MSNANASPSPRAALSGALLPPQVIPGSLSDVVGPDLRIEESKQNEFDPNFPEDSIRADPDNIAGAFNSVEQNLIAIENNNLGEGVE